jgi:hypothetical protein
MISAVFLVISSFLASYSAVDSSRLATINEDYYYKNIKEQFWDIVSTTDCEVLPEKLDEFRHFTERAMGEMGYMLYINYTISCPFVDMGMIIGSDKMTIYENINASEFVPDL